MAGRSDAFAAGHGGAGDATGNADKIAKIRSELDKGLITQEEHDHEVASLSPRSAEATGARTALSAAPEEKPYIYKGKDERGNHVFTDKDGFILTGSARDAALKDSGHSIRVTTPTAPNTDVKLGGTAAAANTEPFERDATGRPTQPHRDIDPFTGTQITLTPKQEAENKQYRIALAIHLAQKAASAPRERTVNYDAIIGMTGKAAERNADVRTNTQLIEDGNAHITALTGHAQDILTTKKGKEKGYMHPDGSGKVPALAHPIIGPALIKAQGAINAAKNLFGGPESVDPATGHLTPMSGAFAKERVQGEDRQVAKDSARADIRDGMSNLLEAHDALNSPVLAGYGIGAPPISRASIEVSHATAIGQLLHHGFKRMGKAPNIVDIAGAKVDRTSEDGKRLLEIISKAVKDKIAGVQTTTGKRIEKNLRGRGTGTKKLRKKERQERVDAGEKPGIEYHKDDPKNPAVNRRTQQAEVMAGGGAKPYSGRRGKVAPMDPNSDGNAGVAPKVEPKPAPLTAAERKDVGKADREAARKEAAERMARKEKGLDQTPEKVAERGDDGDVKFKADTNTKPRGTKAADTAPVTTDQANYVPLTRPVPKVPKSVQEVVTRVSGKGSRRGK